MSERVLRSFQEFLAEGGLNLRNLEAPPFPERGQGGFGAPLTLTLKDV